MDRSSGVSRYAAVKAWQWPVALGAFLYLEMFVVNL